MAQVDRATGAFFWAAVEPPWGRRNWTRPPEGFRVVPRSWPKGWFTYLTVYWSPHSADDRPMVGHFGQQVITDRGRPGQVHRAA
jgi:hypothetical protein